MAYPVEIDGRRKKYPSEDMMKFLRQIAEQFTVEWDVIDIQEYGSGNINDTYLVTGDKSGQFILQRINMHVFSRPELIIQNQRTFTDHIDTRILEEEIDPDRRWHVPHIWKTRSGEDFLVDSHQDFWRATSFVPHSHSYDTVLNDNHAREAGYALGRFHNLLSDLDVDKLHDTLEGFHITPQYVKKYDEILAANPHEIESRNSSYCHQSIKKRRSWAHVLETAKEQGELQQRIIHGDPKINNIMICDQTGQAVSVVDLDTVKPGLVHYDIGDCLRSSCNMLGEETTEFDNVYFDTKLAKSILEGYISVAKEFLTDNDFEYMVDAICLIPFELGLRFFTDYLAGDIYFKVKHKQHNLDRAIVQFKLTESIEEQESEIHAIIAGLKP